MTLIPNMQQHSDKLIRGKTPQLPIIGEIFVCLVTQLVKEDTAVHSS